jgi:hypothetical protein
MFLVCLLFEFTDGDYCSMTLIPKLYTLRASTTRFPMQSLDANIALAKVTNIIG